VDVLRTLGIEPDGIVGPLYCGPCCLICSKCVYLAGGSGGRSADAWHRA